MPTKRNAGQLFQGTDESLCYIFDWTAIGTPAGPTFTLLDFTNKIDASSKLVGVASVVGNKAYSPLVGSLELGITYRLNSLVTIGGNRISAYVTIITEL